ncbi:MAG: helix-turn-helix transcriptional regulator [Jatrophihabitantaceae bacterium]
MYDYIRAARAPVTRDQAAAAVGISRKLAAFHLDKLVAAGLLRASFQPADGPRKVGRSPKVYQPVDVDIRVSLPERQYELLAGILVDALLTEAADETGRQSALRVARERGRAVATAERARLRSRRLGAERALTLSAELLDRHGYQPERVAAGCLTLRSCPFHPIVEQAPELVCGLNHAYLTGLLAGLEASTVQAVLTPQPGRCCVELRAASR